MTNGEAEAQLTFEPVFVPEHLIIIPLEKVPEKPAADQPPAIFTAEENPIIINIETLGLRPWESRIISIGFQDPAFPGDLPSVIMMADEKQMIEALFAVIREFGYNMVIGYGYSFDLRFVVLRAMKLGINCKQFADMEIYDLGQSMAQVKHQFVYFPQRQPKLSDIADFLYGYPKPFTDLQMMKYYQMGQFEKVLEFTASQITRILMLYLDFRNRTESDFIPTTPGIVGPEAISEITPNLLEASRLTIPEANAPETWHAKCPVDLSEWDVPLDVLEFTCPIDGTILKKP